MKVEYIIIIQDSGIPIYSHCFDGFCSNLGNSESLLAGFLSALNTMPKMFGTEDTTIQNIEMGTTRLNFYHTTPSGKIAVIGVDQSSFDDSSLQNLNRAFDKINDYVEYEWDNKVLTRMDSDQRKQFEHELLHLIEDNLGTIVDNCGPKCLLNEGHKFDKEIAETKTLWDTLQERYRYAIGKLKIFG